MTDKAAFANDPQTDRSQRVILFHGFPPEELNALIDALKLSQTFDRRKIIMATTTEQSINWQVRDLIDELVQEHAYFHGKKENTPDD